MSEAADDRGRRTLEDRIAELETQLAFNEDLHRHLDEVVARQDRELLELRRLVKALAERIEAVGESASGGPAAADEVPPHY